MPFPSKRTSYLKFIDSVGEYSNACLTTEHLSLLDKFVNAEAGHGNFNVSFFLDLTQKKYLHLEGLPKLNGYPSAYLRDGGLEAFISIFEQNDFALYNEQIFPDLLNVLHSQPHNKVKTLLCSRNYRLRKKDGTLLPVLQQNYFIPDPSNNFFIASFGTVTDVSHFVAPFRTVQTIEEIEEGSGAKKLIFKKAYFLPCENIEIGRKELEVLKWMSEGLSSKQIADRMKISVHTANTHRKNMLYKTNCKSSVELITMAVSKGLL